MFNYNSIPTHVLINILVALVLIAGVIGCSQKQKEIVKLEMPVFEIYEVNETNYTNPSIKVWIEDNNGSK
jgi:hypothetical protein